MNILEYKRKAAGHVYREGGEGDRGYTPGPNDEFIWVTQGGGDNAQLVQIPNPNYVKTKTPQEQAQEVVAAKLGVPISSVVWGGAGWVVENNNGTASTYNNSGEITNTFTPRKPNEGGFFDKVFADLDRDLKLSENAPAILGIAALVLGQPYITELISSVGAEAAAAEMIGSGVISAEAAAGAGLAAGELGLAGGTAGAGNLAAAGAMGGTAAATTGASLGATSGLADFGLGDILSTTTAPTVGQGAVLTPAATAGTGAMGAGIGGAATTAAGEILGTGVAESGLTLSSLLKNPGETLGNALGITDPNIAKLAGDTIINTARNGGNVQDAIKNTAISYGLNLAGSTVSTAVKDVLKDIPTSELSDSVKTGITNGLTNAAVSIFQGKNPLNALAGAALNTAVKGITDAMPGFKSLPLEAQNVAKASITAKLTGKSITNAALNAAMAEGKKSASGYIDQATGLSPEVKAIADAYKDPSRRLDVVQPNESTAANPISQDPAQRAGSENTTANTNNPYDLSTLTNAGLSEANLSEETVADMLGTTGNIKSGSVTAGVSNGNVTDAGTRGGNPLQNLRAGETLGETQILHDGKSRTFVEGTTADGKPYDYEIVYDPNSNKYSYAWYTPYTQETGLPGSKRNDSQSLPDFNSIADGSGATGSSKNTGSATGTSNTGSQELTDDQIEEIITGGQTNLGDTTSQEILDALGDTGDTSLFDGIFGTGLKGDQGERGSTGLTGTAGERGFTGERGEAGATGLTGSTGATGERGERGEIGSTGSTGAAGGRGERGEIGSTGSTGSTGAAGGRGETGATGLTGTAGERGFTGERGETGATGFTGLAGAAGEIGATGSTGAAGERGERGEIGATGLAGLAGLTGAAGERGERGEIGATGAAGLAGLAGAAGERGEIGATGAAGAAGLTGAAGAAGERGSTGAAGAAGAAGERGETGERGEAGVSQTPEQIRTIIDDALAANPSLTEEQVAKIVNTAITNLPAGLSSSEVTKIVDAALTTQFTAAETARQTEVTNQKAREAANLKTIQTGQLRGQMQSGLQGLIGGLQQQATQMAAPAQVETVKATPGFDFRSPLNTGFFGGYESQKTPPKDKQSLKMATGGYLDDLLEAIR